VAGQLRYTTIIKDHVFSIKEPLWEDEIPAQNTEVMEVNIDADAAFSPEAFGVSGDTRILSYRVHKLALVDERGAELVLYSDLRAWLLRLALPVLVSWKSLLVNHDVPDLPYQELGRDLRQLRMLLQRPRLSRKLGGSSR
jgi:hypothetical protein